MQGPPGCRRTWALTLREMGAKEGRRERDLTQYSRLPSGCDVRTGCMSPCEPYVACASRGLRMSCVHVCPGWTLCPPWLCWSWKGCGQGWSQPQPQ